MAEGTDVRILSSEGERILNTKGILFIGGGAFSDLYSLLKGPRPIGLDASRERDADDGEALYNSNPHNLVKALKQYGMIPELLGRLPVIARFRQLTQEDLIRILTESEDSPIKSYEKDFAAYGITIEFTPEAYPTIARLANERDMGARGLKSVIEESLTSYKFHLPGMGIEKITITSEAILKPDETLLALLEESQGGG